MRLGRAVSSQLEAAQRHADDTEHDRYAQQHGIGRQAGAEQRDSHGEQHPQAGCFQRSALASPQVDERLQQGQHGQQQRRDLHQEVARIEGVGNFSSASTER